MAIYRTLAPITYVNGDVVESIDRPGVRVDLSPAQAEALAGLVAIDHTGDLELPRAIIVMYPGLVFFPKPGYENYLYLAEDTGIIYRWNSDTRQYVALVIGGSGSINSVNGKTTADVVLDADDILDGTTNHKFATAAQLAKINALTGGVGATGAAVAGAGTPAQGRTALGSAALVTRSITEFGAVADGTYDPVTHAMTGTDNTAAINAALATGQPVSIPPGVFYFSGVLHTNVNGSGLVGQGSRASYLISNQARNRHLCVDAGTTGTTWVGFTMIGPHVYNGSAEGRALIIGSTGGGTGTTSTPWDASGTWIDDFVTRGFVVGVHISVGNDVQFGTIETYETGDSRSEPGGYGITCSGSNLRGLRLIAKNTATRGRHALYFTGVANNCYVEYIDAKGFDFAAVRNRATTGGGRNNGFGLAVLDDCNTNLGGGDGTIGGVVQFVCANDVAVTGAGGARIGDIIASNCGGIPGVELRYMPNSVCGSIQIYGHSANWGGASHYGSLIWNSPNTRQPIITFASGFDAAGLNDATLVPIRVEASAGCYDGRTVAHSGAVFTNTPTYDTVSAAGYLGKVDRTVVANRVYGTGSSGEQRSYGISVSPSPGDMVRYTGESNVAADSFIASMLNVTSAATTTVLTVDSFEIQRITGSATHIFTLPTTSVVIGRPFEFINDSTGAVTINASDGTPVLVLASGDRRRVRALQATPTTAAHWTIVNPPLGSAFGRQVAATADASALNRLLPTYINPQTGTAYTAALTDAQGLVTMNNAAANIFSIPTNASVAFPIGSMITVAQIGAGQTSFAAVSPGTTTLRYAPGAKIAAQYSSAVAIKIATDEWLILGALAA